MLNHRRPPPTNPSAEIPGFVDLSHLIDTKWSVSLLMNLWNRVVTIYFIPYNFFQTVLPCLSLCLTWVLITGSVMCLNCRHPPTHTHLPRPHPRQDTVQGQAAGFPQTLCALPCWTHVGQDCWSYGLMRVSTTDQVSSPSLISSLWTNLESKSRRPHVFEGQCQVMSQVFRPKSMSSLIFELKSESSLLRAVPSPVSSPLSHVEVNSLKVKYQVKSFLWSCQVWSLNSSPSQFSTLCR